VLKLLGLRVWRRLFSLAFVLCGLILGIAFYNKLMHHGPFWEKYQQVHVDMEEEEVTSILGPPTWVEEQGEASSPYSLHWTEKEQTISVQFDCFGIVCDKHFTP
jgi:SmpA / OmlA family